MRICYLGHEERRQYLQSFASSGVSVERLADFVSQYERPVSIESKYEEYLSIPSTLDMVVEAERRGYDAVLTGCFGDPGVDAARELVRIPVIGPGEASIHTAAMLGDRFSILTIMASTVRPTRHQVRKEGLLERLASVRSIEVPVLTVREGREETYQVLRETARYCLREDGADVLITGCASLSHVFADRLQADLGVPVVNALKLSLRIAELLVGSGLSHSKLAFPVPPKLVQGGSQGQG
jgi:allantoin racemase